MKPDCTTILVELEAKLAKLCLPAQAYTQYSKGKIADIYLLELAKCLTSLSQRYLSGLPALMTEAEVKAYSLYYLPINLVKLRFLLEQISTLDSSFSQKELRVLDFGCGPGTAALATLEKVSSIKEIVLFDASKSCLDFALNLCKSLRSEVSYKTESNPANLASEKFDLIIAANVLTELEQKKRQLLIKELFSLLNPDGILLILEPALFKATRNLMLDRQILLETSKQISILFPCTHSKICPMLEIEDDWCHGTLAAKYWQPSQLVRQMDLKLGFNKHRLKYAAMIFKASLEPTIKKELLARVIRTSDNRQAARVCCENGLLSINPKIVKSTEGKRALKASDNFRLLDLSNLKGF